MTMDAHEVIEEALEGDDGWIDSDEIGPILHCDTIATIALAALSAAGFTLCEEQVGYQYADGTLSKTFSRYDMQDYCKDTVPSVTPVYIPVT